VYAGFDKSKDIILNTEKDQSLETIIDSLALVSEQLEAVQMSLIEVGQTGSYFRYMDRAGVTISIPQRLNSLAGNTRTLAGTIRQFSNSRDLGRLSIESLQAKLVDSLGLVTEMIQDVQVLERSGTLTGALSDDISTSLKEVENYAHKLDQVLVLAPDLLGFDSSKKYMLLLQNYREIRPTGGFIGNYGTITVEDGQFEPPHIQDVYYLNYLLETIKGEKLRDPDNIYFRADEFESDLIPNKTLIENIGWGDWWNIKDGNWVADFPFTAKKIEYSFDKIFNQGQVDGVIAFDPKIILDILKITGPIALPADNIVLDQDNFLDIIENIVEFDNPFKKRQDPTANPKQIIIDFADVLRARLATLEATEYFKITQLVIDNLETKHISLYFNNPRSQALTKQLGYAGELKSYAEDYLYINRSSRSANKSSQKILDEINYHVLVDDDLKATAELEIKREHIGGETQLDQREKTFWQIMVPSASRITDRSLPKPDGDATVHEYEFMDRMNVLGLTEIYSGELQTWSLKYSLPFKLHTDWLGRGTYELFIQKQPGVDSELYQVEIKFPERLNISRSSNYSVSDDNLVIWKGKLRGDYRLSIDFGQ
jgi:hypothetical protein